VDFDMSTSTAAVSSAYGAAADAGSQSGTEAAFVSMGASGRKSRRCGSVPSAVLAATHGGRYGRRLLMKPHLPDFGEEHF